MAANDFCRLCKRNIREAGPSVYCHSTDMFVSKTTPSVSERLALIGLIVAQDPEQSNRCCQRCTSVLGQLEKYLPTFKKWEENIRESKLIKREREPSPSETPGTLKKTCPNPPSPPASCSSGNTPTKVTITYPTQTLTVKCHPEEDAIIKNIALKKWRTAANHALKHRHLQQELKEGVIKLIRNECDVLCSRKYDFILWKTKPADLMSFTFKSLRDDLLRLAPFLLSIFNCVTNDNDWASCTAAATAIRGRNPQLSALSYWINTVLQKGGAKKSVFNSLSKLSITTSYRKATIKQQELVLDCGPDFARFTDFAQSDGDLHQWDNPQHTSHKDDFCMDEQLLNQEMNWSVNQEEILPVQIKEEQEDLFISQEETLDQPSPEADEQEDLCNSQEETLDQLSPEAKVLMLTGAEEQSQHSEPETDPLLLFCHDSV